MSLEAQTAAMWDGARYELLAERLLPAAERLGAEVRTAPAGPVLDLAAGIGSVAIRCAEEGRAVEALDIAPGLVEIGRTRSEARGLDVRWRVGSFDDLRDPPDRYAAVTSSFGLIFAPDPVTTLRGVARVLAPDGLLALSVWEPGGYLASMSRAMARRLPPQAGDAVRAWIDWGERDRLAGWLDAAGLAEPVVEPAALPWRFADADAATAFLFRASPGHVAAARAVGDQRPALERAVRDHLVDFAGLDSAEEPVDIEAAYLIVTTRRA